MICIMGAIERFSPYKYWINTKKQSKIAEKSDIRGKVIDKDVSVGFFCIEIDGDICAL